MRPADRKTPRAFSDAGAQKSRDNQKYDVDPSKVAKAANYQSGLSMVSGSLGGKSPEELAAERAAAEKAAADAAAKEQAPADPAGAGAVPDPAAMAAAAAGDPAAAAAAAAGKGGSGPFGQRFGSLSSSLGGGSKLSGGAGLSGGMSGKFDTAKLGGGLRGFGGSQAAPRSTGKAPVRGSGGPRGLAGRQLNNAFRAGQAARTQGNTGAAYTAGQPFDNGMHTDKMIADPSAAPGAPGNTSGTGGGSNGGGGSGGSQPTEAGTVGDSFGEPDDCSQILPATFGDSVRDVTYENSPSGGCVIAGGGVEETSPWENIIKIGKILTWIAAAVMVISAVMSIIGQALMGTPYTVALGVAFYNFAIVLAGVAAAMGAIIALMGIAVIAMGNSVGGGLLTGVGGLIAAGSIAAALSGDASAGSTVTSVTVPTWIIGGAGLVAGAMNGIADAASDDY